MTTSFFIADGDALIPTDYAVSLWSPNQLAGHGVCGAAARELERHRPDGFVPARTTVDLFMPVLAAPFHFESEVARKGRRIVVADARLVQECVTRTRATAVFVATNEPPPGRIWAPDHEFPTPPSEIPDPEQNPSFHLPDGTWTDDWTAVQSAERKTLWRNLAPIVAGEADCAYARAAVAAETTSLATNWGDAGVGYINTDLTMALTRLPESIDFGVRATDHQEWDGVAVGVGTLFDRRGPFGSATVTALSNARRMIDLSITAARA